MWRFVNTGYRRGKFNMQYDEYLAQRLSEGKGTPTVRVFGWKPYAISIGFHQREGEIDLRRSEEDGIDVVRRPTGGRAILHAHELTYSVVMFSEGRSVMETYEYISRALIAALRYLGVKAELSRGNVHFSDFYKEDIAVSCFTSSSRYEVQYEGKKIIGSARRRYISPHSDSGGVLLQHGSLLLGPQHRRLADYISLSSLRTQEVIRHMLDHTTTEVETILQRKVSFDEATVAIRRGFEEAWGINFVEEGNLNYEQTLFLVTA